MEGAAVNFNESKGPENQKNKNTGYNKNQKSKYLIADKHQDHTG